MSDEDEITYAHGTPVGGDYGYEDGDVKHTINTCCSSREIIQSSIGLREVLAYNDYFKDS